MDRLSFVIPCYRSEKTVAAVIDEIIDYVRQTGECDYEIIAVDDHSPDNVYGVLTGLAENNRRIKVIRFAKNFGQHAALLAGIRASLGDFVIVLDDDGQCPLDQLTGLLAPLHNGYDISIAQYGKKAQSRFKNFGSAVNEYSANILIDKPREIQMSNYMAFKRFIADEISRYDGPYPYLSGLLFRSDHNVANVPMKERVRTVGTSNYTFHKMFALWVSGFTAFSIKPLRFAIFAGSSIASLGLLYGLYIVIRKLFYNDLPIPGWSSLIVLTAFLGGLILLVLGIIGEYVGRIYMTVNQTPQYVVSERINIAGTDA